MRVFKVFVLLGGMGVEMKGGMTGGMKIEESLCLKGSAPSDGRDGALFVKESTKIRTRNKTVRCPSTRRAEFSTSDTFNNVPLLGTGHSLLGNRQKIALHFCVVNS